jgi:hypothetical protein
MPPMKNGAYWGIRTRSSSGSCAACAIAAASVQPAQNRITRCRVAPGRTTHSANSA